jgi:hypothetical protein
VQCAYCSVLFLNTVSVHGFPFFFSNYFFLCLIDETVFCFIHFTLLLGKWWVSARALICFFFFFFF